MSRPLRVALVTPGWPGHQTSNGIVTSVFHLASGLAAIGHTPVIITTRRDGTPDGPAADCPVIEAPAAYLRLDERLRIRIGQGAAVNRSIQARRYISAIRTAVDQHGIEAVVMEETNGWAGLVAPRIPVPMIVALHGPWSLLNAVSGQAVSAADRDRIAAEEQGFRAARALLAPSASALAAAEAAVPDAKPRAVIPHAYPVADPRGGDQDHRPGHILFVGRIEILKGADTALDAFARLAATHPDARLTLVGPDRGPRPASSGRLDAKEEIARLPEAVRSRIDYLGARDSAEIAALRKTHPIALIASRYETFGFTVLEAMAAGQAIVCTRVGGPAEILEDGETARLVPPGDGAAMARALAELLDDPALRTALARAARDRVATAFRPDTIAGRTAGFLRDVLSAPP